MSRVPILAALAALGLAAYALSELVRALVTVAAVAVGVVLCRHLRTLYRRVLARARARADLAEARVAEALRAPPEPRSERMATSDRR